MTASRARLALASWLLALPVPVATWQAIVRRPGAAALEEVAFVVGFAADAVSRAGASVRLRAMP
jgi:hypothetical protein